MTDVQSSAATELPIWSRRTLAAGATLTAIVALADILFYPHEPGVSLALFCLALVAGVLVLHRARVAEIKTLGLTLLAVLGALPLIESENLLWWPMAMAGVSLLALSASGQLGKGQDWLGALMRFAVLSPVRLLGDGIALLAGAGQQKLGGRVLRLTLVWIVPVASAAVFAFLFVAANPVLELGLHAIRLETLLQYFDPMRVMLWGFIAAVSWPILSPRLLRWTAVAQMQGPMLPRAESVVFGAEAIRNSLIVFNGLFAVQTLMDLAFLWGGVRLPDGISYAEYAHRGAYPLIVTAVLAGAFVLAAMAKGGAGEKSALIRMLVYLWIAQNVWLVVSSILRLELYVEAYSLTGLRIAAGIWMGLVATGLVLILIKIALGKSNRWLIGANSVALALTLYGVAWVDFPAVISRFNVEHSYEVTGEGMALDFYYVNELGPGVIPALDQFLATAKYASEDTLKTFRIERNNLSARVSGTHDWQSWTWREARLAAYVEAHPYAPESGRAIN